MGQNKTGYVSEIDQFLKGVDKQHPGLSETQKKEKLKHDRVYRLRDQAAETPVSLDDWL